VSSEKNGLWVLCDRKTQIFLDIYVPGYAPKVRVPTQLSLDCKKGGSERPNRNGIICRITDNAWYQRRYLNRLL